MEDLNELLDNNEKIKLIELISNIKLDSWKRTDLNSYWDASSCKDRTYSDSDSHCSFATVYSTRAQRGSAKYLVSIAEELQSINIPASCGNPGGNTSRNRYRLRVYKTNSPTSTRDSRGVNSCNSYTARVEQTKKPSGELLGETLDYISLSEGSFKDNWQTEYLWGNGWQIHLFYQDIHSSAEKRNKAKQKKKKKLRTKQRKTNLRTLLKKQ